MKWITGLRKSLIWALLLFSNFLFTNPPKAVVFDYGGVIAKVNRKPVIEFVSTSLNIPYERVKKDFAGEGLYIAFNKPYIYWEQYAQKTLSKEWFEQLEALKREVVKPVPGMNELILSIRSQGIRIALLSNTNKYRARFLESMGSYQQFDPVLLSCYLGVKKPNPEIYKKLLNNLKVDPQDCLFIDNRRQNIEAARKLGIQGIVFRSVTQLKQELPAYEIN